MEKAEECFYFSVNEQQAEPPCHRGQVVPTASGTAVGPCLAPGGLQVLLGSACVEVEHALLPHAL